MTVSYYCKSCKKNNKIKTKSINRFELQQELGDEISQNCKHCGTIEKRHINRLTADPNYTIFFITLLFAIVGTVFLWNLGFIALITFTAPIWAYFDAINKANLYNKTRVTKKNNK